MALTDWHASETDQPERTQALTWAGRHTGEWAGRPSQTGILFAIIEPWLGF